MSRNGKTQLEVISKTAFENFWIGPSQVLLFFHSFFARLIGTQKEARSRWNKHIVRNHHKCHNLTNGCCKFPWNFLRCNSFMAQTREIKSILTNLGS